MPVDDLGVVMEQLLGPRLIPSSTGLKVHFKDTGGSLCCEQILENSLWRLWGDAFSRTKYL